MKIAFLLLAALLLSCQKGQKNWELDQVQTGTELHNSAQMTSLSSSQLQLQILKTDETLGVYVVSSTLPFDFYEEPSEHLRIKAQFGKEPSQQFFAKKHAGGYRLKIPDEQASLLIKTLLSDLPVVLEVSGSELVLSPEGFKKLYKQMLKFSFFDLPVTIGV